MSATYRNLTDADVLPASITRQWFHESTTKAIKGSEFGLYAVAVNETTGQAMVLPLVNQSAVDRAAALAAEGYLVNRIPDARLVETRVTGEAKPRLTQAQQAAMAALIAGTATDEQKATLASLV